MAVSRSGSDRSGAIRPWPELGDGSPDRLDRFPIVAHASSPWSTAFPRPFQTHATLARRHPVLYIERPSFSEAPGDRLRLRHPTPRLAVAEPVLSSRDRSPIPVEGRVRALLRRAGWARELPRSVHWLYRPEMAGRLELFADPLAVVYDCTEDCAGGAAAQAERELLERADLVFASGHDLFRSRFATHPGARLAESGVDFDHFRTGAGAAAPSDLERIPRPRVGFVGVLDERVDFGLLRRLAAERPRLSVVLVGPLDGLPRARLPRAPNLFHLGPRPYEERPACLGGLDACLLPYRSETRHGRFDPPQALEYLAAGRPVVATPLPEVLRRYADVVSVAGRERFAAAVDEALAGGGPAPELGLERARAFSWPGVVGEMEILVARIVQQRLENHAGAHGIDRATRRERRFRWH